MKMLTLMRTRGFSFCLFLFTFAFLLLPFSFAQDYSKFLHTSQRHASVACSACHHRNDNSAQPSFPGHKDCFGCHGTQFGTPNTPLCSICHTSVNGNDPPRKAFPGNFKESFNMKFDHAQHLTGAARPKSGCVACHSSPLRRGVALSIPTWVVGAQSVLHLPHSERASEWTRPRVVQDLSRSEIVRANSDQCRRVRALFQSRATRPAPTSRLRGLSQLHRRIAATATGQFNARS